MKIYNELESLGFFEWLSETHNMSDTDMKPDYLDGLPLNDIHRTVGNSMVFRFFRENHDLYINVTRYNDEDEDKFLYYIDSGDVEEEFNTYEEAELECLRKLIEIVKTK